MQVWCHGWRLCTQWPQESHKKTRPAGAFLFHSVWLIFLLELRHHGLLALLLVDAQFGTLIVTQL